MGVHSGTLPVIEATRKALQRFTITRTVPKRHDSLFQASLCAAWCSSLGFEIDECCTCTCCRALLRQSFKQAVEYCSYSSLRISSCQRPKWFCQRKVDPDVRRYQEVLLETLALLPFAILRLRLVSVSNLSTSAARLAESRQRVEMREIQQRRLNFDDLIA
ncbi:hypothetical protein IE81DRAFT_110594 [Ceraceosorus guamensis]|uniref:Uncharacterized protein n=1 Tax=Ceraceosorus guamensis TaxID=1522189 RepID=A0A316W015_9BASI|nr:hypothetical protein IE81DRAFT_110594 [Ceraceosorus guamensis]PWN42864.1 hypothetical protein IE81DRAFT_110594 [Ceraceosorus guamensis]